MYAKVENNPEKIKEILWHLNSDNIVIVTLQ